ncbi:PREDICTED: dehydrogenase/reductase SDR family protein 7-like isoform X2 [Papilio xuthus]|uniref:Dehydrogenase/reductase SDR family protein 7-like isoform X2 n=1 Tax=Papilio xuthus TaxID=66420 RepID=A0AAJ7ELM0_PAPXU|nr:PREDICTED: dehydrogenase/reductase SDR family protein 7-like isoform X2 [Papilio xuthus]
MLKTMKVIGKESALWYLQYFGIPLSLGIVLYKIINNFSLRKRRATLQGKVVVITGASSGIGEALSHVFYQQGCKVVMASRRKSELERVKQDLISKKMGISIEPIVIELDLGELDQLESFVDKVHSLCGHIDILVNNGGISHRGSILHTKLDVYKKIMNVNYLGSVGLTAAALPKMVERKSGHIVFISSVQGLIGLPERSAYAGSKHAMQAYADSLRAEMKQHNINVSVISPGYVKTAVSINALTGSGEPHGVMDSSTAAGFSADYVAERIVDTIVNKEKELIISQFMGHYAILVRRTIPSLYFYFVARRAAKT